MKKMKKLLSLVLAMVMCLGMVNLSVFAAESAEIESIAVIAVYEGYKLADMAQEQIADYDELGITLPSLDDDGWAQIDSTAFVDGTVKLLFCIHVQGDTPGTSYIVTSDESEWVGGAPMLGNLPDEPISSDPFRYGADIFVTKTFSESDIVTNEYGDWLGNQASVEPHQTNEDASGEWDWVRVNTKVTLTYDANAGEDEVTGLPVAETVNKGEQVTIKSYRDMKREGYHILGWSVHSDATWPDNDPKPGDRYTLNEDTTLYAVWEKDAEPGPEIPEGAKLQTVEILPSFFDSNGAKIDANLIPAVLRYEYSYTYQDKTYTGEAKEKLVELIPGTGVMGSSGNPVFEVLVDETGAEMTQVQLTLKGYHISGYSWYAQMGYDATAQWTTSKSLDITAAVNSTTGKIWMYNYYKKDAEKPAVTERDVDIQVAFEKGSRDPFDLDAVNEDYSLTYSYEDADGNTVTETLLAKNAERVTTHYSDEGFQDSEQTYPSFKWTITMPVIGEGSYLTVSQSNYDVSDETYTYVWDHVYGTQNRPASNGDNVGQLYVSKDNNPVTPYIFNVYAKEFTVTYTDGVEGSEVFADQTIKAKEGDSTPTFDGTPSRSGYTFTGWSPSVAATVTGNSTYVAQWSRNSNGGGGGGTVVITPDPTPTTPDPGTDIPDENPPLANVNDKLNTTDHFAYVIGYPDGEVKPEQNITRAEAVTIFYRLMTDTFREQSWSTANSYPDTDPEAWYNCAISTATKAGIFKGDTEGTARPDDSITRAEFAALAARFISDQVTDDGAGDFADTADHWAAKEIRLAVKAGWIQGVGGNRFEPDRNITRAEVMTLVNRMLDRVADKDHMLPGMKEWTDNMDTSAWYYEAVQEATNDHDYDRIEGSLTEQWTKIMEPKDWITLEKGWIANNGASAETEKK